MRFVYEYRTSDNALHHGIVVAADRDAAYEALKARGIRPARLVEAPGILNKLFGKGKRWIAIVSLAAVLLLAVSVWLHEWYATRYAEEERAQIFGDPAILQQLEADGWRGAFGGDEGAAWMARHAIPGRICDCLSQTPENKSGLNSIVWKFAALDAALVTGARRRVAIHDKDGDELRKMKRIVNCMKRELVQYLADGGTAAGYRRDCCERQKVEVGIFQDIERELQGLSPRLDGPEREGVLSEWNKRNATLRSLGLPTVPIPNRRSSSTP